MSSDVPGSAISTILLGSRAMRLAARSCQRPVASKMVSPSGKRGMISRSTKRDHALSLTAKRLPMLRPNRSWATSVGRWPPRHSTSCALAPPASADASKRIVAARSNARLSAEALDGGAAGRELVLEPLEAAVEVIDAIDHGLALGRERGDHEGDRGAQIGGHHRRALEGLHPFDGGALAVEVDMRAEPHQLLYVHEAVLEDRLGDARCALRSRHQRHELGLQVGGKAREGRGRH